MIKKLRVYSLGFFLYKIIKVCYKLSVEAIVAKPEYKDLFPSEIVDTCRKKLRLLGYNK